MPGEKIKREEDFRLAAFLPSSRPRVQEDVVISVLIVASTALLRTMQPGQIYIPGPLSHAAYTL